MAIGCQQIACPPFFFYANSKSNFPTTTIIITLSIFSSLSSLSSHMAAPTPPCQTPSPTCELPRSPPSFFFFTYYYLNVYIMYHTRIWIIIPFPHHNFTNSTTTSIYLSKSLHSPITLFKLLSFLFQSSQNTYDF